LDKIYYLFLWRAILSPIFVFAFINTVSIMAGIITTSIAMFVYAFIGAVEWFSFRQDKKANKKAAAAFEATQAAEAKREAQQKKLTEEFFAKNAQRPEIKTLPDGTQYEILNEGDPNKPKQEHSIVRIGKANNPEMKNSRVVEKNVNNSDARYASSDSKFQKLANKLPNVGSKYKFYLLPTRYNEEGTFLEIEVLDELDPAIFTTPSGLRYEIISKGDESKPKAANQIIEQNVYCDGEPCDKKFTAPVWFKEGSLEKEAYDLMKHQGAKYRFYQSGTTLTKPSFDIEIKKGN
jgi:hypothetical protein